MPDELRRTRPYRFSLKRCGSVFTGCLPMKCAGRKVELKGKVMYTLIMNRIISNYSWGLDQWYTRRQLREYAKTSHIKHNETQEPLEL
jgi:hypothetical protein